MLKLTPNEKTAFIELAKSFITQLNVKIKKYKNLESPFVFSPNILRKTRLVPPNQTKSVYLCFHIDDIPIFMSFHSQKCGYIITLNSYENDFLTLSVEFKDLGDVVFSDLYTLGSKECFDMFFNTDILCQELTTWIKKSSHRKYEILKLFDLLHVLEETNGILI